MNEEMVQFQQFVLSAMGCCAVALGFIVAGITFGFYVCEKAHTRQMQDLARAMLARRPEQLPAQEPAGIEPSGEEAQPVPKRPRELIV